MSEYTLDINSLQEIAQKSLEVVQKILGVEPKNNSDENELESKVGAHSILSDKKLPADELTEQKHYLIEQKRFLSTKYAENKLLFEKSRQKFLNRSKRRNRVRI